MDQVQQTSEFSESAYQLESSKINIRPSTIETPVVDQAKMCYLDLADLLSKIIIIFSKVKAQFNEKYHKDISIFGVFLKFTKFSKVTNNNNIDQKAFEQFIKSLGFSTDPLKLPTGEGTRFINQYNFLSQLLHICKLSLLDQLFQAFDKDQDGFLNSHDFVDTLRGLDSETLLKLRVRQSKNIYMNSIICKKHVHMKMCSSVPVLFKLEKKHIQEANYYLSVFIIIELYFANKKEEQSTNSFIVYPNDPALSGPSKICTIIPHIDDRKRIIIISNSLSACTKQMIAGQYQQRAKRWFS